MLSRFVAVLPPLALTALRALLVAATLCTKRLVYPQGGFHGARGFMLAG